MLLSPVINAVKIINAAIPKVTPKAATEDCFILVIRCVLAMDKRRLLAIYSGL
jgi:hypothetical protein